MRSAYEYMNIDASIVVRLARHAMQPHQRRVLMLRYKFTVYDARIQSLVATVNTMDASVSARIRNEPGSTMR